MIDPKILLALAILLGSLFIPGNKAPAGGLPIPQQATGVITAK
jgi:hypothetical protein